MSTQQLDQILAAASGGGPDFRDDPYVAREDFRKMLAELPTPKGIISARHELGGVPGLRIRPENVSGPATVLYLHGGAYIAGSASEYIGVIGSLALALRRPVHAVDYRLAPEAPYPAAIEDAVKAYHDLVEETGDPSRIAVVGDSAGGGLTLALLLALRQEGSPLPATAILLSPWTDLTGSGESMITHADQDPILNPDGLMNAARHYLNGADAADSTASPVFADFSDLPPIHVHVGSREILLDDAIRVADHSDATLTVWEGMVHDWCLFWFALDEAREVIEKTAETIRIATLENTNV